MKAIYITASIIVIGVFIVAVAAISVRTYNDHQSYAAAMKQYETMHSAYVTAMSKCDYSSINPTARPATTADPSQIFTPVGSSIPQYCFERWEPMKPAQPKFRLF
jgi:hypothetical protein